MRVVVIGAGFAGLSAAAHLASGADDITVLERRGVNGGRAAARREHGFRLELGPTVFTLPDVLDEAFAAVGASMNDELAITRCDPTYRATFADGSTLRVRPDREAMTEEIRSFAGAREAGVFNEFCEWLTELHRLQRPNFIDTNYDGLGDLARPWRALAGLATAGGFRRLDTKVASFFDDERLRRVFSFQSMYAGVAPAEALALYSVITYMDAVSGVYTVRGGLQHAASRLATAVRMAGVRIVHGATATQIVRDGDGAVAGVEVDRGHGPERIVADAVVCTLDVEVAYRTLLGGLDAPRVARRGSYSPSCVLLSVGAPGVPDDDAAAHNIHFGAAFADAFGDVRRHGRPMRDPSTFVSVPSVVDPTAAPDGSTSLTALEVVPNLDGRVDWTRDADAIVDRLRARVAAAGYPVADAVVEHTIDPLGWQRDGMARGTPFGLAHTWRQTGPLRPANRDRRVAGLAFAGSSTVPGVGVPMVLLSGKLAAERIRAHAIETSTVRW